MSNSFWIIVAQTQPEALKPWEPNWALFGIVAAWCFGSILLVWLWAKSGRSKYEKKVPFERTAEDFAGTVQAGYGQIPYFLIAIYLIIAVTLVGYIVNSIITGVQY